MDKNQCRDDDIVEFSLGKISYRRLFVAMGIELLVTIILSLIWAQIMFVNEKQYAVSGLLVGLVIGFVTLLAFGKKRNFVIGCIGFVQSIVTCFITYFWLNVRFISSENDASYMNIITNLDLSSICSLTFGTFDAFTAVIFLLAGLCSFIVSLGIMNLSDL